MTHTLASSKSTFRIDQPPFLNGMFNRETMGTIRDRDTTHFVFWDTFFAKTAPFSHAHFLHGTDNCLKRIGIHLTSSAMVSLDVRWICADEYDVVDDRCYPCWQWHLHAAVTSSLFALNTWLRQGPTFIKGDHQDWQKCWLRSRLLHGQGHQLCLASSFCWLWRPCTIGGAEIPPLP